MPSPILLSPRHPELVLLLAVGATALLPTTDISVRTVAGSSTQGDADGVGTAAELRVPTDIGYYNGYYYFTDTYRVRRMHATTYEVETIAGQLVQGSGDGDGTSATFKGTRGLAIHPTDNYALICDNNNYRVRHMLLTAPYTVSIAAGFQVGYLNGAGTSAKFMFPEYVAISPDGNTAVVVEASSHRLRLLDLSTSPIPVTLLAGGTQGSAEGSGTAAQFSTPRGVTYFSDSASVLVADSTNDVIRRVVIASGASTTWCGDGTSADAYGECASASFKNLYGLTMSSDNVVFVSDEYLIKRIDTASKVVSYVAGSASGFVDGDATSAKMSLAKGFAFPPDEDVVMFCDNGKTRIRQIYSTASPSTFAPSAAPSVSLSPTNPATDAPSTEPSAAPSPASSTSPTSAPTASSTMAPTRMPTEPVAEHIIVHAVDLHGDGWGNDLFISVEHHDTERRVLYEAEPEMFSLSCACKVLRIFSSSGDMTISMYRNSTSSAPFEWEALFALGYSDGLSAESFDVYGDVNSVITINNWNVASLVNTLNTNEQEPKNRCIPPPKPKPAVPSPNATASVDEDMKPGASLANVRLTLMESEGNGWCDDSGDAHEFTCSKEGPFSPNAMLPNLLTYPRYFISDEKGHVLMQQGTMRIEGAEEDVREVKLPREGKFVFSVSGHYLPESGTLSWDFCGEQGEIGERLHFDMVHGVCKPHYIESLEGELSCGAGTSGVLLNTPLDQLTASSELSQLRHGYKMAVFVAAAVGMVALVVMLFVKGRRNRAVQQTQPKMVQFARLDTTEHA